MKKANVIVMTIAGLVLIVASILKAHQLLTEPIISSGFWESWLFFVIQVPLELGLGIWLVSGLFRKAAWLVATLAFAGFICVTLHKGLIGAASCGCFGRVHVNPWITLSAIDIPLFLLLVIFRPVGEKLLPPPWPSAKHFFGVAIPSCIVLAALVPTLVFNKPPARTDKYEVVDINRWMAGAPAGQSADSNDANALDANQVSSDSNQAIPVASGRVWPMLGYIDIADELSTHIVVVVLYSNECDTCHDAIPLYDQMARQMTGDDTFRIALIEIPPYAEQPTIFIPSDSPCLLGRLSDSKQWYMQTPVVAVLVDGLLVKAWQGEAPDLDQILDALTAG